MRHNALKTFDGKTAATTDQIPAGQATVIQGTYTPNW